MQIKNLINISIVQLFFVVSAYAAEPFSFLAISDMHCSEKAKHYPEMQAKTYLISEMEKCIENPAYNVRGVLMPGDLTGGNLDDLGKGNLKIFKRDWVAPLTASMAKAKNGAKLYLGVGNHDFDARRFPSWPKIVSFVVDYAKATTGYDCPWRLMYVLPVLQAFYSFNLEGVHFVTPGVGPYLDEDEKWNEVAPEYGFMDFLKNDLKKIGKTMPLVIFMHYSIANNLVGSVSKKALNQFYNIIKPYNIKLIVTGHTHNNSSNNFKGFWNVDVSGKRFAHCIYDADSGNMQVFFVDKDGNKKEVFKPATQTSATGYKL